MKARFGFRLTLHLVILAWSGWWLSIRDTPFGIYSAAAALLLWVMNGWLAVSTEIMRLQASERRESTELRRQLIDARLLELELKLRLIAKIRAEGEAS